MICRQDSCVALSLLLYSPLFPKTILTIDNVFKLKYAYLVHCTRWSATAKGLRRKQQDMAKEPVVDKTS